MAIVFDTRNAVQRLIKGGLSETQADAVVDVTSDATSQLVPKDTWEAALDRMRDQLRIELWRAIALQTLLFTAIVAALTKL